MFGAMSTPVTAKPRAISPRVASPVPHARSSARRDFVAAAYSAMASNSLSEYDVR
jgi:hypothetical protein